MIGFGEAEFVSTAAAHFRVQMVGSGVGGDYPLTWPAEGFVVHSQLSRTILSSLPADS